MQVAFKAAVPVGGTLPPKATVQSMYDLLIELHADNSIALEDAYTSGGGSSKPKITGTKFTFENVEFEDFRDLKKAGEVKATFPDFRTSNGAEIAGLTNDRGSVWLIDRDGAPNRAAAGLVAAADVIAQLVA